MRKSLRDSRQQAKKPLHVVVLVALCLFCPSLVSAQDRDPIQHFEQIATLIRDNRLSEAERELSAVLRSSPDLPLALNLLGTLRAKQGRLREAENLFLRAVAKDQNFNSARMNLAYLYLLQRSPKKSMLQLQQVLALDPAHAEATEKLAELLLSQGRFDECISFLEKSKTARSLPAAWLVLLGDAYLAKKSLNEAEERYLQALEGRLDNAGALFGLAQISRLKGENREASIYLNRVATLAVESKSPDFLYRVGMEALRLSLSDEAKLVLERSLELKPKEPAYLLALGVAWLSKGDLFEAEKIFRRLIQIQPGHAQGELHLGYVLLNQKKYNDARLWLERSVRSGVAVPEVHYYLGLVAQEQNDDARAIGLFAKAVQKLPTYAHARIALGASYMKLKNYARARQELEMAVKLDPDEPTAHYNLALLYARIKEPAKAQEELRIIEKLKAKGVSTGGVVVLPPGSSPL